MLKKNKHHPNCQKHHPHCGHHHHSFIDRLVALWCNAYLKLIRKKAKIASVPANKMKIAFISVWGTNCGISTYNDQLINYLRKICDVKVFAEYADVKKDPDFVIRCWDRKDSKKAELLTAINEFKPDIVHIGHEYGIFPSAYFYTLLITKLQAKHYQIVTTLHSVYEHEDKIVHETLTPNIICHSEEAKSCLINKGIKENKIQVIAHGTKNAKETELNQKLWNTWNSSHVILHPGFLFYYKGHLRMLDVINQLKAKYPDVHYVILGSENHITMVEHEQLYNDLIAKINDLQLQDNVTIHRGFVSEKELMSFIRTVTLCVLPYQPHEDHDVYATSGIARMVLGTTTPLITSDAHLFDDIKQIVPQGKNNEQLIDLITKFFECPNLTDQEIENRKQFLKNTSWSKIAKLTADHYKHLLN